MGYRVHLHWAASLIDVRAALDCCTNYNFVPRSLNKCATVQMTDRCGSLATANNMSSVVIPVMGAEGARLRKTGPKPERRAPLTSVT